MQPPVKNGFNVFLGNSTEWRLSNGPAYLNSPTAYIEPESVTLDPSRAFLKDVKRLIVKVGTAVVTRSDGRLALGRLGALCEQLKELNSRGYEVILVTSGAVGLGRQRLRYRRLANSSFSDLQKPQGEFDGKACAAVGQSSLMALYDTMFSQLDVTSSQLLVNDGFFRDAGFRKQLSDTVHSLLNLRVIPIFNENDAVSTRKAPYEDSSGIFWDNDSLAGLLALELKADLLVLLSDVEGLYSGPPSDPNSKLIDTYVKKASKGNHFWRQIKIGERGYDCQIFNSEERRKILLAVADALENNLSLIMEENGVDIADAELAGLEKSLISHCWACEICSNVGRHEGTYWSDLKRIELADKLTLERISCPLGVVLVIFESRPDALVQVITSAIPEKVGDKLIGLVTSREEIPDLLKLDDVIDLVVPRGSNKLVSQIKESTKIPVLGHSDGICHVYVDKAANIDMAKQIVKDAKIDYPAACNAMETLLVHKDLSETGGLNQLVAELTKKCCCIPQCKYKVCDGARFGLGAEVGISTSRIHARGPVGVEGYEREWAVVDGDRGVTYTHKELPIIA
ncbi:Delta-1-pyrroline-5-carboxylate synthase [Arachis hypogaea]|nr:Delta-1-pyrroline-5-carboxylate synthase [Arachis hypogaea]